MYFFFLKGFTQQHQFTNLSLSEGLAQSQVFSIIEDSKGYIWMGTRGGGVSRYNGLEFENFNDHDGLPSNYILSLYEDHEGVIWIGTSDGIAIYDKKTFKTPYTVLEGRKIHCIFQDKEKQIWVGTDAGVFIKSILDSSFQKIETENALRSKRINFIDQDSTGNVWIGCQKGLYILTDSSTIRLTNKNGLNSTDVKCLSFDANGTAWVGTYGNGVNTISKSLEVENRSNDVKLNNAIISSIYSDSKNRMWFSTFEKGVCVYNLEDGTLLELGEKNGLANNNTKTIIEDRWSNYWIGTSGGGVSKYAGQQFEYFTTDQGLKGNYIYALSDGDTNEFWVSTSGGGVMKVDSGNFVHYGLDSGFTNHKVRAILKDNDSTLWFGLEGRGIAIFSKDTFSFYTTKDGLGGNWVKDIVQDKKGTIWIATSGGGITKIDKEESGELLFSRFKIRNGLMSNRINQLLVDKENRLWYSSQTSGIGYIENSTSFFALSKKDGLKANNVRSMCEDAWGNLWVGTSKGLSVIPLYTDTIIIKSFEAKDGLSSQNIYLLNVDIENNLWIGTEKGVDKVKIDNKCNILEIKHFGYDEGFYGVETTQNATINDKEGNLWIGSVNGLHKFLPQVNIKNDIAPILHFTDVSVQLHSLSSWDSLTLKYHQNQLSFDFIGITQTFPKKIKYKWFLEGADEKWSPVSDKHSVTYFNLEPGVYTFKVLSKNENNVWNEKPISISFTITPPIWREIWFIILSTCIILFGIGLIIAIRFRMMNRKQKEKQEKLRMERDLISLEQKALRLQMNPHFIFNSLNSIQSLIAMGENAKARKNLSSFSKLMRQILDNSRKNKITLEQEIETLKNYLTIEKQCNDGRFDFEFKVDYEIETELIEIPSMMLQPFVENAVKHGMVEKLDSGLITIHFSLQNKALLKCTIRDNGVGIEASNRRKRESTSTHKSTALRLTKERIDLLEGEMGNIEIRDLSEMKEMGTEVNVWIPIEY